MENEVKEIYLVEDETQESGSGILGKIVGGVTKLSNLSKIS